MSRKLGFIVAGLAAVIAGLSIFLVQPGATEAEGTCPEGDGWVKIDWANDAQSEVTHTAPEGQIIDEVCIKASTSVINVTTNGEVPGYTNDDGDACYEVTGIGTSAVTIRELWTDEESAKGCSDISHTSVHIVPGETPTPTNTPETPTPTNTPETPTPTNTPETPTPTNTPETATPTNTPETATPTNTPETATPTNTPETATPTNTPETATPTNTPETATPTNTPETATPTNTPETATPTNTPETATPTATNTPEVQPTQPQEVDTPTPAVSATAIATSTAAGVLATPIAPPTGTGVDRTDPMPIGWAIAAIAAVIAGAAAVGYGAFKA